MLNKYATALDNPLVKKILPRYVKVVRGGLPANFQIAKRIVADLDRNLNVRQMWEMLINAHLDK